MKKFIVLLMFMLVGIGLMAQDTTNVTIDYVAGESILTFFKDNFGAITILLFAVIEYYIGKNDKLAANSTLDLLIKFIKSFFVKK